MLKDMWSVFIDRKDFFLQLLLEHLEISLVSILIAILFGGFAGILISEFQKTAKPTLGVINFLYTIPSISMLGFLIPFSGVGNATAMIALTVYALLPMVRNTHTGITNVDPAVLEAAKGMGSTKTQILFKIKLPLALPVIMSGIRNMVTMTIALAGIASFIGAGGLGVAIYRGITTNNAAMTMVGSLLIALLALVMDFVLGFIEKRMKKRSVKTKSANKIMVVIAALLCLGIAGSVLINTQQKDTIHIATKPMTEQYVLGEMLDLLIEQDTDLNVELTQGIGGGTSNIQPAMESGEFNLYPEYTGTGWNMVLKHDGLYTEDLFGELENEYSEQYDMNWVGMYGFNNTYGLVVRRDIAEKYNLKTCSDLKSVAGDLTFGAEYDFFEREDGYDAFCEAYGLTFGKTMDLDIGLKYQAINQKQIDVMVIFTTDGQLSASDVVVLEDDKNFYPSYICGNVIRGEVLKKYPELEAVFKKLNGLIQPTSGDIFVDGENIRSKNQTQLRRNIGYAIQGSVLFPHMTVEQNISYVPSLLNKRDKEKTKKAVLKWMEIVGLSEDLKHRYPAELSGGQQQRVGIARALAASPDILLMDEPFGAVDEITRGQLQTELKRIHRQTGITVLFVTHDISEALKLGTKVLVMNDGKIEQFAKPEDLLRCPATEFVKELVKKDRL